MIRVVLLLLVMTISASADPAARPRPDLFPETSWPSGELAKYTALSAYFGPHSGVHPTTKGIVVGSSNVLAVNAGVDVLRHGGNAMDACLATAISQTVLAANQYVSFAGVGEAVYYDAKTNTTTSLQGLWRRMNSVDYLPSRVNRSNHGASVLVHGFPRFIEDASRAFGRLDFASLFDAAIYFAESGAPITPILRGNANAFKEVLTRTPSGQRLYDSLTSPNGTSFTQPEFAALLKKIQAASTVNDTYTGDFARDVVDMIQKFGADPNITVEVDFAPYKTVLEAAVKAPAGHHALPAQNSMGTTSFIEQTNIAQTGGLFGVSRTEMNATQFSYAIQISRWSQTVETVYLGGAAGLSRLSAAVPSVFPLSSVSSREAFVQRRRSAEYAAAVWDIMTTNMTNFNNIISSLFPRDSKTEESTFARRSHSDSIVAVDADGNVCSMMHTLNAMPWGSGLVVSGVALSDAAYQGINRQLLVKYNDSMIQSPTRPLIGFSSTGQPTSALSVVGDSLEPVTLQQTLSLSAPKPLDYGSLLGLIDGAQFHFFFDATNTSVDAVARSVNVATPCQSGDQKCIIQNVRVNAASRSFLAAMESWASPTELLVPLTRFTEQVLHSGLSSLVVRGDDGGWMGAVTPGVNGAALGV